MSNPYVTLLVGSLDSMTVSSLVSCTSTEDTSLGEYLTWWWETLPYFTSVFLNFIYADITKFSPPFFRLLLVFLLNTSMWTANFIFSCATECFRNIAVQHSAVHTQSFACSFYINQIFVQRVDWITAIALRMYGLGYFIQRNSISCHFIFP